MPVPGILPSIPMMPVGSAGQPKQIVRSVDVRSVRIDVLDGECEQGEMRHMKLATVTTRERKISAGSSATATAPARIDQSEHPAFYQALSASLETASFGPALRTKLRQSHPTVNDDSLRTGLQLLRRPIGASESSVASATPPTLSPPKDSAGNSDSPSESASSSGADLSADSIATPLPVPVQPAVQQQLEPRSSSARIERITPRSRGNSHLPTQSVERDRSAAVGKSAAQQPEIAGTPRAPTSSVTAVPATAGLTLPCQAEIKFTTSLADYLGLNSVARSLPTTIQTANSNEGLHHLQDATASNTSQNVCPVEASDVTGALPPDSPVEPVQLQQSLCSEESIAVESPPESNSSGDVIKTAVDQIAHALLENAAPRNAAVAASEVAAEDSAIRLNDQARWVEQLLPQTGVDPVNPGELQIKLQLAELGALQIGATLKDGRLTARLDAKSLATQRVLREHLSELEAALVRQGLTVDLQVRHSDQQGEWPGTGHRQAPHDAGSSTIEPVHAAATLEVNAPPPLPVTATQRKGSRDHLDIHI